MQPNTKPDRKPLLNKKNRNRLIKGLIKVFILALLGIAAWVFTRSNNENKQRAKISNSFNSIAVDSSKQSIGGSQINQEATFQGNSTNEVVGRDKIVNNYSQPEKSSPKESKVEKTQPIVNEGGFVNIGGEKNTYNQTIINEKPLPRNLSPEDISVLSQIPTGYFVSVTMCIEKECRSYGEQIISHLKNNGFSVSRNLVGMSIGGPEPTDRFNFKIDHDNKRAEIMIQRLQ